MNLIFHLLGMTAVILSNEIFRVKECQCRSKKQDIKFLKIFSCCYGELENVIYRDFQHKLKEVQLYRRYLYYAVKMYKVILCICQCCMSESQVLARCSQGCGAVFEGSYGNPYKNSVPPHSCFSGSGFKRMHCHGRYIDYFENCIEEAIHGLLIDNKPLLYVLLPGSEELV